MRNLALVALLLLAMVSPAPAEETSTCAGAIQQVSAVRTEGRTEEFFEALAAATTAGCSEAELRCLGDSLALGQLEATYKASDEGTGTEPLIHSAEKGLTFGAPWQLETALGDLYLELGRAGGGGPAYSSAALHYQQAMIAIGEPVVCAAFGEAPRPATAEVEGIYRRLSAALLLADPLRVVTTRCAPCEWLFLSGVGEFVPHSRPLPITFELGSDEPTQEGLTAIAALLECLRAGGETRIELTGHADLTGSSAANLRLSRRRLEAVRQRLKDGGFTGEVLIDPRGETEPFVAEAGFFSQDDERRLGRRIELKAIDGEMAGRCEG